MYQKNRVLNQHHKESPTFRTGSPFDQRERNLLLINTRWQITVLVQPSEEWAPAMPLARGSNNFAPSPQKGPTRKMKTGARTHSLNSDGLSSGKEVRNICTSSPSRICAGDRDEAVCLFPCAWGWTERDRPCKREGEKSGRSKFPFRPSSAFSPAFRQCQGWGRYGSDWPWIGIVDAATTHDCRLWSWRTKGMSLIDLSWWRARIGPGGVQMESDILCSRVGFIRILGGDDRYRLHAEQDG